MTSAPKTLAIFLAVVLLARGWTALFALILVAGVIYEISIAPGRRHRR